jgi:hypothetical protein
MKQNNWLDANPNCKQVESCSNSLSGKCVCPKQTIEEVAKSYVDSFQFGISHPRKVAIKSFIKGYNHAQTEIEELKRKKEEFIDTLGLSIQIIERLIASEKVVNLDEFLGYFKQLITKHNKQLKTYLSNTMTESKQKAYNLVDKMNGYSYTDCVYNAIICVEELIKDHEQDHTDSKYYFWQEVLTHLKEML